MRINSNAASTDRPIYLALAMFALGLMGVMSLMLLPLETLLPKSTNISPITVRALALVQPLFLVTAACFAGAYLGPAIGLTAPSVRQALIGNPLNIFVGQAKRSLGIGLAAGLLIQVCSIFAKPFFDAPTNELIARLSEIAPPLITRILYGGISEEIIMRFGLMTLIAWLLNRIIGGVTKPPDWIYFVAILLSSAAFAIGHFPIIFAATSDPPTLLLALVFIGNFVPGAAFGWAFWKFGIESSMSAHAVAHLTAATAALVIT
jgi:hypothetical protein